MKKLILLCSSLLLSTNNVYLTSTEQHIGDIAGILENNNAHALSCTINLVGCKQFSPCLKKLAKTFLPSLLNCKRFDNISHAKLNDGFKACLFNDDATISLHIKGTDIYIEVTNSKPFNPYLISAYLANFFQAAYFNSCVLLR